MSVDLLARPVVERTTRRSVRLGLWCAVGWLAVVVIAAALADVLPIGRYDNQTSVPRLTPPGFRFSEPLGTDAVGRSMTARLVFGARQSLLVGVLSVAIGAALGCVVGLTAGYMRGKVDRVISVLLDALLAFPPLILLLAIAAVRSRSLSTTIAGLSILLIAPYARVVRANTLALAGRQHILAARLMGAGRVRIMFREILPHVLPAVTALGFVSLGSTIVVDGSLSFLGLGMPPPKPSWGGMVNEGLQWLYTTPYLVLLPSLCLLFTVLAFRRIGEALLERDRRR